MEKQNIFIFIFAFLGLGLTMIPSNLIQRYLGSIPYIISIGLLFLLSIFKIDFSNLENLKNYDYTNFYLPLILMGFMITAIIQVARNLYAESGYFYVNQILFFIPLIAFAMFPKNGASKQDESYEMQELNPETTTSSSQNPTSSSTSLGGGIIKNIVNTSKWVWLLIAALAIGIQMILLHIIDLTRNFFETDDGEKQIKELEAKLGINN